MVSSGFKSRLAGLLEEAREQSKDGRQILVSVSERIGIVDPLAVLESLDGSALSSNGCAYWARPCDDFSIAAIGSAISISHDSGNRFSVVDTEWRAILDSALIDDGHSAHAGVGPLLIGGFSFDPAGPTSSRWAGFPAAHTILPRAHITLVGGESWLTFSAIVDSKTGSDGSRDAAADLEAISNALTEPKPIALLSHPNGHKETMATSDIAEADWCNIVENAVSSIRSGNFQKVVLARSVHTNTQSEINPFGVLRELRRSHHHAFVFGYWRNSKSFVGASPERLIRLKNKHLSASSLAGTVKRGASREDDAMLAQHLQTSAKDLEEHAAVRDMLYEILSEVGDNVRADRTPRLLTLSNVHHLHTEVEADLKEEFSLLDVVSRLHPTPAVGGTPRMAALEFIRDCESLDRGWYAAPFGWIDRKGGEFAVALRSGLIDGTQVTSFAGCGIVADSNPELELAESVLKLEPMKLAVASALEVSSTTASLAALAIKSVE